MPGSPIRMGLFFYDDGKVFGIPFDFVFPAHDRVEGSILCQAVISRPKLSRTGVLGFGADYLRRHVVTFAGCISFHLQTPHPFIIEFG